MTFENKAGGPAVKRAACIEDGYFFKELPFEKRFAAAKAAGFDSVEFWSWRELNPDVVGRWAADSGIQVSSFIGADKGSAIDPDDHDLYLRGVSESLDAARRMGAPSIYIFSDEIGPGGVVRRISPALSRADKIASLVATVRDAADLAAKAGIRLIFEPVNSFYVHGYFTDNAADAIDLMKAVDRPEVKMVYDFYHQQLVGGNLIHYLRLAFPYVASIHVADVPGRVEPGLGEINFTNLAREMDALGYADTILFESTPKTTTEAALKAIETYFPRKR